MLRRVPTAALLLAGGIVFAGSPARLEPLRQAVAAEPISITGTDMADSRLDTAETSIVVLPGAPEYRAPRSLEQHEAEPAPRAPRPALIPFRPPPAQPRQAGPGVATVALPEPPATAPLVLALLRKPSPPGIDNRPAGPPSSFNRLRMPEDFERDGALYLQRRLGVWREEDARRLFGSPVRQRAALDPDKQPDGTIAAFSDPTRRYREFELDFDARTGYLRTVFVYPWKMRWDECRKMWGVNVISTQAANGRWFHSYENRRLDVLVDPAGTVISLGLY